MKDLDLEPLAKELEALVRSERAAPAPSAATASRLFGRIAQTLATVPVSAPSDTGTGGQGGHGPGDGGPSGHGGGLNGHGGGGAGHGATAASTGAAAAGAGAAAGTGAAGAGGAALATGGLGKTLGVLFASKLVLGTATFVAGGIVGAGVHSAVVAPARQQPAPVPAPPSRVEPAPPPPAEVEPEPAPEPAIAAPAPAPKTVPAPRAVREAPPPADRDAALASERAVLEIARTALSRQKPEDALEALTRHARVFPHGQLAEERDALEVQALVGAGRNEEAHRSAARFRQRYPTSLLAPAVDAAERSIPR